MYHSSMREKNVRNIVVGGISTNCWVYPLDGPGSPAPCALIDPGEEGERIIAFLDRANLFPAYIILTHGHFDHVAAVPTLAREYRAEIVIHAADAEYLGPNSRSVHCRTFSAAGGNSAYIDALWQDMPAADRTLADGDKVGPFTVLHVPGHTPGSIGLWDQGAKVLFSGDTLFRDGYGRTDLPGGNRDLLLSSLDRLATLDGDTRVYPGHGPETTIGEEVRR